MSIPKVDPTLTVADLSKAAAEFEAAGAKYWDFAHRAGVQGAVVWVKSTNGALTLYTRGEYSEQIIAAVEHSGPVIVFGAAKGEDE